MSDRFRHFSRRISGLVGSPWAFVLAISVIITWAVSGPLFQFSDTWQLAINTGTTIITFLMVFIIQNTQNRDAREISLKLDELVKAVRTARNDLVDLEDLSDKDLAVLEAEYREFSISHRKK